MLKVCPLTALKNLSLPPCERGENDVETFWDFVLTLICQGVETA